ncbi:Phloem protein 2 [Rhynchospora pubera]|uniref:Phloem protein 2 n=1 Tax=Rhynchospora pubera TaxID=906938 RepID=A0AAV8CLB3_9POAL|nr:Phloem protein 2 [Rhynchospora pubera]KAJ4792150.1 Phloem protein 2 [Rhynchospora pubera]KAJ4815967.1 Phloem protein 2 [Rhynchospora pubera]
MPSPHYKGSENSAYSQLIQAKDGNNKVIIKPQALDITWGNDPRYWRLHDKPRGPAELLQVCWLEVNGSIDLRLLKPNTDYTLHFNLFLKPDAFGWNESPVYFMVKVGKNGKPTWRSAYLRQDSQGNTFLAPNGKNPLKFRFDRQNMHEKLIFGLYEVWRGRWKGGLIIEDVVISVCR